MCKFLFTLLVTLSFFLPQITLAQSIETFQKNRCNEISQQAERIVDSDLKPLTITVKGSTLEKALINAVIAARQYIDSYSITPPMCKCLESVLFVSNEERALLTLWGFDVAFSKGEAESVKLVMTLDKEQLEQIALFNMWPMLHHNFKKV